MNVIFYNCNFKISKDFIDNLASFLKKTSSETKFRNLRLFIMKLLFAIEFLLLHLLILNLNFNFDDNEFAKSNILIPLPVPTSIVCDPFVIINFLYILQTSLI